MSKIKKGSYLSRIVSQKDRIKWKYKLLKQENQQLKELVNGIREERDYLFNKLTFENQLLIDRIDKAIEYMDNTFNITSVKDMFNSFNELERILKGVKYE